MRSFLLMVILLASDVGHSQTYSWKALALPKANDRYNDVWFATPSIGWAIIPSDGFTEDGIIYKTEDAGVSWRIQYTSPLHLRSICFLDSLTGFVGFLYDGSSSPLLKTTDGGITWNSADISGAIPAGICGMMRVNDSTIVATGQVFGPGHFLRTTDRGATWHSILLPLGNSAWGIDCYFWSRDSGIVAGGSRPEGKNRMVAHIWQTTDGGTTWLDSHVGVDPGEWCWKISFPSSEIGYVALEHDNGPSRYLKTTDRGRSWLRSTIFSATTHLQGCGFISNRHGWVGGRSFGAYVTEDGGLTWDATTEIQFVNRFRFFGDTLGYAAGDRIYKLSRSTSNVVNIARASSRMHFDAHNASLQLQPSGNTSLSIADVRGREVLRVALNNESERVDVSMLAPGVYIARLASGQSLKFSR